jgi:hypothetical protein
MEPLPPVKEVEYRCIIGKAYDEILDQEFNTFSFETAKEFSSFRYEIAVRYKLEGNTITFRVLGMTATRMMMPAFGTAQSVLKVPQLQPGRYTVTFIKSDANHTEFFLDVTKKGIQIGKPIPRKRFIDLVVRWDAAPPAAKIVSTVSKSPHIPLVPRTIQKRVMPPPTPEELEILEALREETPEERDAREEMELFGKRGSKTTATKAPKKEASKPAKKAKTASKPKAVKAKKPASAVSKKKAVNKSASKPKPKAKPIAKKTAKKKK